MKLLAALVLTVALAAPVAAESYYLDALTTTPLGSRFYLMHFGKVTLEAGEKESVWLSLASCPGGFDSLAGIYVSPLPGQAGAWRWQQGWIHPVPYGAYQANVALTIWNDSAAAMTFRVKASARCQE